MKNYKKVSELGLEVIELQDQVLLVDKNWEYKDQLKEIRNNRVYISSTATVSKEIGLGFVSEFIKIKSSTKQLEGLPLLVIEDEIEDIWEIGNIISVTTLYDLEERKSFPNHNEHVNLGKQTYIGEIIEIDKGMALKTNCNKIFNAQSTYWFGSILHQDWKLIKKGKKETYKFTEEDLRNAYHSGGRDMHDKCISHNWRGVYKSVDHNKFSKLKENFIQSVTKKELWVEVELHQIKASDKTGYTKESIVPKITNNQIKAVWK